jgi:tetratricopeptide (TPR) repeat protein
VQVRFQYSASPSAHLAQAFELANKAIELDGGYAWGYIALGGAHLANGDPDAAVNATRQALTLEPNGYEPNLFMGFYLQFAGEAALAVEHLLVARRQSPVVTVRDLAFMQLAQFMAGNYAEVVRIGEERNRRFPGGGGGGSTGVILAAAYAMLDRTEEAAAQARGLLEERPGFNLSQWRYGRLWRRDEDRTRLYKAAKKAGIPEFPREE